MATDTSGAARKGAKVLISIDFAALHALYGGTWALALLRAALAVTFLGSGWMMLGLVAGFFARGWRAPSTAATLLLVMTSAAVAAMKALIGRVRPCQSLSWAHALAVDCPNDGSFPSGHAAGSFAFACFVLAMNRRAGAPLLFVAALIALSRVVLGVHYPSDVMVGATFGGLLGFAAARLYRRRRNPAQSQNPGVLAVESKIRSPN